jgi:hypothetical protein
VLGNGVLGMLELAAELAIVSTKTSIRLSLGFFAVTRLSQGILEGSKTLFFLLSLKVCKMASVVARSS